MLFDILELQQLLSVLYTCLLPFLLSSIHFNFQQCVSLGVETNNFEKFTRIEVFKCAPRNITVNQYKAHNMISNFPGENVSVRAKICKLKLLSV
jgi:hypothetical protein